MNETERAQWGFFRRPALLGPAIGFLSFLGCEALRSPDSGSVEGLIWLPVFLVVATIFSAIPYLIGASILLVVFRVLPHSLVRLAASRVFLGGLVGCLVAWPFAVALNWIPSATADPRFNFGSMLIGCTVAGGFCAACFSEAHPGAPSNKSLERKP